MHQLNPSTLVVTSISSFSFLQLYADVVPKTAGRLDCSLSSAALLCLSTSPPILFQPVNPLTLQSFL